MDTELTTTKLQNDRCLEAIKAAGGFQAKSTGAPLAEEMKPFLDYMDFLIESAAEGLRQSAREQLRIP